MCCPSCGFSNPQGMKFCGHCGTALSHGCPHCGFSNPSELAFCGQCGTPLTGQPPAQALASPAARTQTPRQYTPKHLAEKILTSRSALEGERKQVTVLFADVVGFTTLAEQRDPEEVHQLINRCFELITAEVHRFEGTINQYTGDGVMALFGAPIAHEDSPRRAVQAALGIQRALREYSQEVQGERGLTLQMRIGLNTGLVVVGKIGDDLRMDYTVVGDTTNLAARLQQLARPGSVAVSEATHRAISGDFETFDLGEVPSKGHTPIRAFEVLRARGRWARIDEAVERSLTPLVGRQRELTTLLDRFSEVKAGRGQVVFIAGEAGIGKSRLVLEFRRALAQAGEAVTWLEGRCVSFGQSIPFLPLSDQLRDNFRIEEFDGEPEIIAKVEHGMHRMGELQAYIPSIRYLLSVDPGDPTIAAMEASARRKQLFEALRALSLRGARLRPLVLVFEDLHWIDTSTEEYLNFAMDSVAAVPLMLILTHRVGYTPSFGSRSFYTTLTLHNLSEAETLAMAGRVLGAERFPQELQAALMERAEGVLLFIEEVTKTLVDLGVLQREQGDYRVVKGLAAVRVPDSLQGIIMARLDRLGDDAKRTVQFASVIGRQFPVRLLERVSGLTSRLEGPLHELKALEIIYELGLSPEPAYIFKHAVIQDVAYNSLLVQRRKELHRSVGYTIEELYRDRLEEHCEELAHHFSQGEVWEKAMAYCRQAGARAVVRAAFREAAAAFEEALVALGHLPKSRDTCEQAIDLRFDLRIALTQLAEYERVFAHLRAAETLAEALQDQRRLGQIAVFMGWYFRVMGDYDRPIGSCQRALVIAEALGNGLLQVMASYMLGHVYHLLGDYRQAMELMRRNMAFSEGELLHAYFGAPLSVASRTSIVNSLAELGEFAEGIARSEEGVRIAEAIADPTSFIFAYMGVGRLYLHKGDVHKAIPALERALAFCQGAHLPYFFPRLASALSTAYALAGRITEALVLLEQAVEQTTATRRQDGRSFWVANQSEATLLAGRLEEALSRAQQALELARAHKERGHEAWILRLLGDVAAQRKPPEVEEAAVRYCQALALAEELSMRPLQARCHHGLGTVYAKIGRPEQARAELSTAIALYRAMEMTFWLPQAEAMLAQVEGQR